MMSATERSYLTIIEWPAEFDEPRRVEALVGASGIDPSQARLAVRSPPPMIAGFVQHIDRTPILAHLRAAGVLAIAPTRAEIERVPKPLAARGFVEAIGAAGRLYMVELWRGESEGLRTEDIRLLVRARLRTTSTVTRPRIPGTIDDPASLGPYERGPYNAVELAGAGQNANRSTRVALTDMLDIYTSDRRRIRINADKFGFEVLGGERSYTDSRNTDQLAVRLAEHSPNAYIDQGFATFRPPADIRSLAERGGADSVSRPRTEAPIFDFYSPWFAMVYSAMLKSH
jgi:hypothetical protein